MSRTTIATLAMICGSFLTAAADQNLEKLLTSQYRDKVLYLRHSLTAGAQEYDADGQLLSPAGEGPWYFYGRIRVTKLAIDGNTLRVEGKRAVYRSDGHECGKGCMPFTDAEAVKVTIRLNGPLSSMSEADAALGRVFAFTPDDVLRSVPAYWQEYLAKLMAQDLNKRGQNPDAGNGKIFRQGENGVTAPKVLSAPEPEFSEAARKQAFQGTVGLNVVIDKTGLVDRVSIAKALGLGLDEESVKTVRTWRFAPATRNGEPVQVTVYVEVDFHLYKRR